MQLEKTTVAVDGACAGDDAEPFFIQPRHGHVADDAAALVEQLRVDDGTDRSVDVVAAHAVEQAERIGSGHLELAERGQVDDADPFTHRRVLDGDPVVKRRPGPAERALILSCTPPLLARAK